MTSPRMLHLNRNQHPSSIAPSLILQNDQTQILSWSAISRDSVHKDKPVAPTALETSPASTLTPPPDNPSSPSLRQDNHGGSGAQLPTTDSSKFDTTSRSSTPLSELSSPSNHEDSPPPPQEGGGGEDKKDATKDVTSAGSDDRAKGAHSTVDVPSKSVENDQPPESKSSTANDKPNTSVSKELAQKASPISPSGPPESVISQSPTSPPSSKLDTKVVTILELNAELLKCVSMVPSAPLLL